MAQSHQLPYRQNECSQHQRNRHGLNERLAALEEEKRVKTYGQKAETGQELVERQAGFHVGDNPAVRVHDQSDDWNIEEQIDLIAARNEEQLPFMPIGSVNLMRDQNGGICQKEKAKAVLHGH